MRLNESITQKYQEKKVYEKVKTKKRNDFLKLLPYINMGNYVFYTDGSCNAKTEKGGWGVVFCNEGKEELYYGGSRETTNNQMELMAIIYAMEFSIKRGYKSIQIYTDSEYCINSITDYLSKWIKNNMTKSDGAPVKNQELMFLINELKKNIRVSFTWVKAHNGNRRNELADKLSNKYWDVCDKIDCGEAEIVFNPCRLYCIADTHNM